MTTTSTVARTLAHAKIVPRRSADRGHANHGWLNTYHTFSFASYYDHRYEQFGSLRVLNEDRVAANSGFPTHPHRDAEIFSYILSGELTHRDSMMESKKGNVSKDEFSRMKRGDVQFTTGGSGIAHSEGNETDDWVHFLQIWCLPWKRGLKPSYHTRHFDEQEKRKGFVTIVSPLKAGPNATPDQEAKAEPVVKDSIPIHADFLMGASIIPTKASHEWTIGGSDAVQSKSNRKVYVHLPMTQNGKAKVRLAGGDTVLSEGDGAFLSNVNAGDKLSVESIGEADAEIVVFDSN